MFNTIWDGVYELNTKVLKDRHKLNYNAICNAADNDRLRLDWYLKYSRALIHETFEYEDEEDAKKSKIELIDVLFFTTALYQLGGFSVDEFSIAFKAALYKAKNVDHAGILLVFEALELEDVVSWKHWKTYEKIFSPNLKIELDKFLFHVIHHMILCGMTETNIETGFIDKLAVNHDRQKSGYAIKKEGDDDHVRV